MTRTDGELVQACLGGDEQAWQLLLERYGQLILSVPRRYGLEAAACDDVFAEVCLAMVRSLATLHDAQALPRWLVVTATRATWEAARKLKVTPPIDVEPLTGAAPPEDVVALLEEEQMVRTALAAISERCRKLLELLYFRAPTPSYDEVADLMAMPRGSLGPTRRRCLEGMRNRLPPHLGGHVSSGRGSPPRS